MLSRVKSKPLELRSRVKTHVVKRYGHQVAGWVTRKSSLNPPAIQKPLPDADSAAKKRGLPVFIDKPFCDSFKKQCF
jgi:hypothetical protein